MEPATTSRRRDERPVVTAESMRKLFDALPPHSPEAEMSLLGSLLLDPKVVPDVLGIVRTREAFYKEAHGAIFQAVVDLYDRHDSGDLVQLLEILRDRGDFDAVGGHDYLVRLVEAVPSAVNAPHYARVVAEKHRLRRLIAAAGDMLYEAHHSGHFGPEGVREVIDRAEMSIFEVAHEAGSSEVEKLADILQHEIDRLEAQQGKGITGIPTGYSDLDRMLSGLQPGEMVIIAARPSMGKTALALNLAEQVAFGGSTPWTAPLARPSPVAFYSLEMSRSSLAQRLISARSGIDLHHLRTGAIGMEEWARLNTACGELHEAPLFIDDSPALTVLQLRARARRMVSQFGVRVIVIDYLQLLTAPNASRESRQVEVATISRGIKALARELHVPVVCLAQLNRGTEQREGNRPRMSDLRESGSIEQDADVVMLLHREEYYHKGDEAWEAENPDKANLAELIVAKQRNGPTGLVKLTWDSRTTRFKTHDPHAHAGDDAGYPDVAHAADASETKPHRPAPTRAPTGPVDNYRDGGGPERDETEDDIAPF